MKIIQLVAHAGKVLGLGDNGGLYEMASPRPKVNGVRQLEWVEVIAPPAAPEVPDVPEGDE